MAHFLTVRCRQPPRIGWTPNRRVSEKRRVRPTFNVVADVARPPQLDVSGIHLWTTGNNEVRQMTNPQNARQSSAQSQMAGSAAESSSDDTEAACRTRLIQRKLGSLCHPHTTATDTPSRSTQDVNDAASGQLKVYLWPNLASRSEEVPTKPAGPHPHRSMRGRDVDPVATATPPRRAPDPPTSLATPSMTRSRQTGTVTTHSNRPHVQTRGCWTCSGHSPKRTLGLYPCLTISRLASSDQICRASRVPYISLARLPSSACSSTPSLAQEDRLTPFDAPTCARNRTSGPRSSIRDCLGPCYLAHHLDDN